MKHDENCEGIAFPLEFFDGHSLTNLVCCLFSRGGQIGKAAGDPDAFRIDARLVGELKKSRPGTVPEFLAIAERYGSRALHGLRVSADRVTLTGIPDLPAFRALAVKAVDSAIIRHWMKSGPPDCTNERYSFRVWLNSIGLTGPAFREARERLLSGFEGDSAYRTREQREASLRRRAMRRSAKQTFVLL